MKFRLDNLLCAKQATNRHMFTMFVAMIQLKLVSHSYMFITRHSRADLKIARQLKSAFQELIQLQSELLSSHIANLHPNIVTAH